jgi:hypothetical protein
VDNAESTSKTSVVIAIQASSAEIKKATYVPKKDCSHYGRNSLIMLA